MVVSCRFYKSKFPEVDEVVMVNVKSIAQMGAYVQLLEYNNVEGMILLSELSRRRIRSINKLIRVGRNECVQVVRVDQEKGYIDLSKRRVAPEEILVCEEKFARGKTINSIMRHTAEVLGLTTAEEVENLFEKTAWYFDEKEKKPNASYNIFKMCITKPWLLDECDIDAKTRETLLQNIKRRLSPQPVKCRADINVSCYSYEGIDAIKTALKAAMSVSTETNPIKITLIAPPTFVMNVTSLDRNKGIEMLNEAMRMVETTITTKYNGSFTVLAAPKVVTDHDDSELKRRLEEAEAETRQIPADNERSENDTSDDDDEDEDEDSEENEEEDKNAQPENIVNTH